MSQSDLVPSFVYSNFKSFGQLSSSLILIAFGFLGVLILAFIIWGGYKILTSGGDRDKVASGKGMIIHTIIGVLILFALFEGFNLISVYLLGNNTQNSNAVSFSTPIPTSSFCQGADINRDGSVDIQDFNIIITNLGKNVASGSGGDVDGDRYVSSNDYNIFVSNYGRTGCL
jgi:hypothetical protein